MQRSCQAFKIVLNSQGLPSLLHREATTMCVSQCVLTFWSFSRVQVTKVKNVKFVELGRYRMETWYYSPFPKVRHTGNKPRKKKFIVDSEKI